MSILAKNSQESVTRYDPFVAFDALDDEQIIAELKGQVLAELVYSFPGPDGKPVEGLSKAGIDACTRELAKQNEVLRELELTWEETPQEFRAKCKVGRYLVQFNVDKFQTVEVLLDTAFGVKRQPRNIVTKDGKLLNNAFAFEQACMKAARNGKSRLIPEDLKRLVIAEARKRPGTVKEVTKTEAQERGKVNQQELIASPGGETREWGKWWKAVTEAAAVGLPEGKKVTDVEARTFVENVVQRKVESATTLTNVEYLAVYDAALEMIGPRGGEKYPKQEPVSR